MMARTTVLELGDPLNYGQHVGWIVIDHLGCVLGGLVEGITAGTMQAWAQNEMTIDTESILPGCQPRTLYRGHGEIWRFQINAIEALDADPLDILAERLLEAGRLDTTSTGDAA